MVSYSIPPRPLLLNLFKDVWSKHSEAEFYGGTSRDFVFYVLKKFEGIESKQEAQQLYEELLKDKSNIDIKYFNNFSFEKKEIFNSLSFSNPLLINSPINYSIDFDIVEEIEFLEKKRKVSKYVETFIAEDIGWKGKNTYFVDETLNVIRTYQRIGPFKSIVEIEYYYKYN